MLHLQTQGKAHMSNGAASNEMHTQLAVGFEFIDAVRGGRLMRAVHMNIEYPPEWKPNVSDNYRKTLLSTDNKLKIDRHDSCLHALIFHKAMKEELIVRVYDNNRFYVPRRLRISPVSQEDIYEDIRPPLARSHHPVLYPGAAYDVSDRITGLRGRVLRENPATNNDEPMRWAIIEAHQLIPTGLADPEFTEGDVIGRAVSDDRGEFLLILGAGGMTDDGPLEVDNPMPVRVTVYGPGTAPTPDTSSLPEQDYFWDLPVEDLAVPGIDDPVASGLSYPTGYVADIANRRDIDFPLGKMLTGIHEQDFLFEISA